MISRRERAKESFDRALAFQPRHAEALAGKGMVCIESQALRGGGSRP